MTHYWIAVACSEHVARGRAEGFMQVCHGRAAPLRRLKTGDGVLYYSPSEHMGDAATRLQAFTALGTVTAGPVYQVRMGTNFHPYRRDVLWRACQHTPIRPLLDQLEFTTGKKNWGAPFRYGLFEISALDFQTISHRMTITDTN